MKATFLTPPPLDGALAAERIFGCNYGIYPSPNIFVLILAAILKETGFEVQLKDFAGGKRSREEFEASLAGDDSQLYLFYTVFLSKKTDLLARDIVRKYRPKARFVFLATEPTSGPEQFVAEDSVVVRGEPDDTVREAAPKIVRGEDLSQVLGISYWKDGRVIHNAPRPIIGDLDRLPFPDRSLTGGTAYYNPKLSRRPYTAIVASRGCANRCYYCVPNSLDFAREIEYRNLDKDRRKPPVRMRSAGNILAEIRQMKEAGYRSFFVLDDQFLWSEPRTLELMAGLKGLDMEWACLARVDRLLNEGIVKEMAEAGCALVALGVESFNQEILDYIKKDVKVEMIYKAVGNLKKYAIQSEINILLGSCPLETIGTIRHTVAEAIRLDADFALISVCTPFPHTEFNRLAREKGWMIAPEYQAIDPMKQSFISYPHLTRAQLEREVRRAYFRFYFRPSYILKRLRRLTGLRDLLAKLKAAASILRK
ncbi:MAG: radical SAM protein [Planctomycetota bacterium]